MKVQFVWNLDSLYSWKTPFNQEFFHVILSSKPFYEVAYKCDSYFLPNQFTQHVFT